MIDTAHRHAANLEACLDFINTLELERGEPVDHLSDPAVGVEWLCDHGVAHHELCPAPTDANLERIRRVRSALRSVADSIVEGRPADAGALSALNRALRARELIELTQAGDGVSVGHRHLGDPLDSALARLVEPLVLLVSAGDPSRLRVCANDGCRWVFYDESRTHRRRWCDMATCGNRAKAARFRERHRVEAADGGLRGTDGPEAAVTH